MSNTLKYLISYATFFCSFTMGFVVNFLSPSILELASKFQTDIATISQVFTILTISFLCGPACGFLYKLISRDVLAPLEVIFMGLALGVLPLSPNIITFFCITGIMCILCGGYDAAQIVWTIELWEGNAGIYIQIQNFCYALGTLASPLIIRPFLSIKPEEDNNQLHSLTVSNLSESHIEPLLLDEFNLYIPFAIGGGLTVLGGLALLVLSSYSIRQTKTALKQSSPVENAASKHEDNIISLKMKITLIALSAVFLGAYMGMEMRSIEFLPAFSHFISLRLDSRTGAMVLGELTAAFTVGRAIGIFLVLKLRPEHMILLNFALVGVGNSILWLFSDTSFSFLSVGAVFLGLGFSTVWPCYFGFIEKHLHVSNVVAGSMMVAGGVLSSMYAFVVGQMIENNPFVLVYTNFISTAVCLTSLATIYFLAVTRERKITRC